MARLGLFLPALEGGGAEQVMLQLAGGLALCGHDVHLVVAKPGGALSGRIPEGVNTITLRRASSLAARVYALRYGDAWLQAFAPWPGLMDFTPTLAAELENQHFDALLCSTIGASAELVATAVSCTRVSTRLVLRESNMVSAKWHGQSRRLGHLRRAYARAAKVVAVSHRVAQDLVDTLGVDQRRIVAIPNPLDLMRLRGLAQQTPDHPWFTQAMPVVLGVGRLVPQKGFAMLLDAAALVSQQLAVRVVILGEGPQRAALLDQAARLGLAEAVSLPGFVANPYACMARAGVMVLPSHYEGLPNCLLEALACGCPVVATDSPGGSAEILAQGALGRLVPVGDAQATAEAIMDAIQSGKRPMAEAALARHDIAAVTAAYEAVLLGV